jgi:hypothetical protein
MMRAGVDAETVRQWGGWKSLETMLRYLADVGMKDSIEAMDKAVQRLAASWSGGKMTRVHLGGQRLIELIWV